MCPPSIPAAVPDRYFPEAEAAEMLGVIPRTVENWCRAGHIHRYKSSDGQIVVDILEIEHAIKLKKIRDPRKSIKAKTVPLPEGIEL